MTEPAVNPALAAVYTRRELVALYRCIRDVAGRDEAKHHLATMAPNEAYEHMAYAIDDGYLDP